jgi:hypothetical protein
LLLFVDPNWPAKNGQKVRPEGVNRSDCVSPDVAVANVVPVLLKHLLKTAQVLEVHMPYGYSNPLHHRELLSLQPRDKRPPFRSKRAAPPDHP